MTTKDADLSAVERPWDPVATTAAEVAQKLDVDPASGLSADEAARRLATQRTEPADRRQEGTGLAGVPASVRGLHAGDPARAGAGQPVVVTGDGNHGGPRRTDRVQRRHRAATGSQGGGERQGAVPDDEDDCAGPSRRPSRRDRRRGPRGRRRRPGRGRQPGAGRRGYRWLRPSRSRKPRSPGEPPGRQERRPGPGEDVPWATDLHGLHEHVGHPRSR